jgi:glutamyl/glutaminyl-tRNA synthetase
MAPTAAATLVPTARASAATSTSEYKQQLLDSGRAYEKDGAIWFKLLGERYEGVRRAPQEDGHEGEDAPVVIDDRIRGRVERVEDEDFVIVRSDGNPVFHLVNVVDDIAMKVTHIIRGEDHLSNTSKHVRALRGLRRDAAGVCAHSAHPEVKMGPGKMSKRDQGALIEEYQQRRLPAGGARELPLRCSAGIRATTARRCPSPTS